MPTRNYISEFKAKMKKQGITASPELLEWFYTILMERYQKGSDDAARIYRETLTENKNG